MTTYARSDQVRADFFENGIEVCDPDPQYYSCIGVEGLKHDNGDVKIVECPDPERFGEYIQVDEVLGQIGRWTTSITGRIIVGEESPLRRLHKKRCAFDLHFRRGVCDIATDTNGFTELEIMEGVRVTSYNTSALASLSSDQRETTTETVDLSARNSYKIFNLGYSTLAAPSEATSTPKMIEIVPSYCCKTANCQIAFFVTTTSAWYTFDGGATWTQAALGTSVLSGGFRVGSRFVVFMGADGHEVYNFNADGITASSLVTTNAGTVTASDSNGLYGLFAITTNIKRMNTTATVVSTFSTVGTLADVVGIAIGKDNSAVAIGSAGTVIYSPDGNNWSAATTITMESLEVLTAVEVKSARNWLVGTSFGKIYCTDNGGISWTAVFAGDGATSINSIEAVTKHIIYAAFGANLYRSVDGGASWTIEPAEAGRTMVSNTKIADIARCDDDPNVIMLAILATNARVAVGRNLN